MRVGILGPLEVVTEGTTVDVSGPRLRVLLTRLALDAGRVVPVESLVQAVWPQGGPADPANALQTLVSRFRRTLPQFADAVRWGSGGYCLDLAPESVDALRFENLTRSGRRLLGERQPAAAARQFRDALTLWRGDALAEAIEHPFAAAPAARLEELRISAVEDLTEAVLAAGILETPENCDVIAELKEQVTAHPLRERLHCLLVRALCDIGRHTEALTEYDTYRKFLAAELGTDPGPQMRAAHLAALRGERTGDAAGRDRPAAPAYPPRSRWSVPRTNLRAPLTSFVGRDTELSWIRTRLAEGRLVTLIGAGGSGKTRLATTSAAEIADSFPGGVCMVELAAVTEPEDVPRALTAALGLRDSGLATVTAPAQDTVSGLIEALSGAETLLVLDNCEHLVTAVVRLADELLARCPQLRVLATSREPLGILGEALCPIPPLPVSGPSASAAEATACAAVRLFADRATAVRHDFTLTEENAGLVAEICRRLDGLPLAIELAAARLRGLPPEELATRLDNRFQLLTGGNRAALPRHRTLRAAVDWSWRLLSEDQRHHLQRLAVFPAGITPAGAAAVCGAAPHTARAAALDTLSTLVDKSLLQVVPGPEARYRMLESIRAYGMERLAERGETRAAKDAHMAYFLRLAESAEPFLRGPDQLPRLKELAAERDNLVAALNHACETGSAGTAVRLGAALGFVWTVQGHHTEAASRLRAALEVPGADAEEAWPATVAFCLLNTVLCGENDRAWTDPLLVSLRARFDDRAAAAGTLQEDSPVGAVAEASLALLMNNTSAGVAAVDRQLGKAGPWLRGTLHLLRAFLQGSRNGLRSGYEDMTAAVASFRAAGERWGQATSLTYLAFMRNNLGDCDGAVEALEESITLLRQLGTADEALLQHVWLAEARLRRGEVHSARDELLRMVADDPSRRRPLGHVVLARIALGDLHRLEGEPDDAEAQFRAAAAELDSLPSPFLAFRAMLACARGQLALTGGLTDRAREHFSAAYAAAGDASRLTVVAMAGVGFAGLQWHDGCATEAAGTLGASHALRGAADGGNPDVVRLVRALHGALGHDGYRRAYEHGRELGRSEALALLGTQVCSSPYAEEQQAAPVSYPSLP